MAVKLPDRKSNLPDSKELLKRKAEFQAEAYPHKDILFNFALRTTGDKNDAQDLLQETFIKAFRFWDKYKKEPIYVHGFFV